MKKVLLAVIVLVVAVLLGCSDSDDKLERLNDNTNIERRVSLNVPYDDSNDNGTDGWHDNMDIYGYAVETIEPNNFISQILTYIDVRLSPGRIHSILQTGGPEVAFNFSNNMASMNFISPKDTGYERTLTFKAVLIDNNEEVPFRFTILSVPPYYIDGDYSCKDQDTGEIDEECILNEVDVSVKLYGVHNVNVWKIDEPLEIELISSVSFSDFSVTSDNGSDITDWFEFNPSGERIVLKYSMLETFKELKDRNGNIILHVDALDEAGSVPSVVVELLVGDSSVSGKVFRSDDSEAAEAYNLPIIFYNPDDKKRYVTNIDENGEYSFEYMPEGKYLISAGDINAEYDVMGGAELFSGEQTVLEHMLVDFLNFEPTQMSVSSVGLTKDISSLHRISNVPQRADSVNRVFSGGEINENGCQVDNGTYKYVSNFKKLYGARYSKCADSVTVAKGTSLLGIEVVLRTEEFIERAPSGKETYGYRDVWVIKTNVDNSTFISADTISRDGLGGAYTSYVYNYCMNVSALTKNGELKVPFLLYANDVGDNNAPTSVQLSYTSGCNAFKSFQQI
jgi:hypothetical protein